MLSKMLRNEPNSEQQSTITSSEDTNAEEILVKFPSFKPAPPHSSSLNTTNAEESNDDEEYNITFPEPCDLIPRDLLDSDSSSSEDLSSSDNNLSECIEYLDINVSPKKSSTIFNPLILSDSDDYSISEYSDSTEESSEESYSDSESFSSSDFDKVSLSDDKPEATVEDDLDKIFIIKYLNDYITSLEQNKDKLFIDIHDIQGYLQFMQLKYQQLELLIKQTKEIKSGLKSELKTMGFFSKFRYDVNIVPEVEVSYQSKPSTF